MRCRIRDMPALSRGRAGKQSRRRKGLHRKIQPKKRQRGDSQQPARTEQERQDDQAGERIFGENIAVPDQAKVNEPERQQHGEPAHEQRRAALAVRKPLELDGKACAEQQRKQRKRLQLDGQRQDRFDGAVDRRCRGLGERNCSKIETRNSVTTLIARTPSKATPRNTSMASIRSAGLIGRGDAAPSEAIAI